MLLLTDSCREGVGAVTSFYKPNFEWQHIAADFSNDQFDDIVHVVLLAKLLLIIKYGGRLLVGSMQIIPRIIFAIVEVELWNFVAHLVALLILSMSDNRD